MSDVDIELQSQRQATRDLIDSKPVKLTIHRPTELVSDGAGGLIREDTPDELPPRERYMGVITDITVLGFANVEFEEGKRIRWTHILVGPYDDDIQENDFFMIGDRKYVIARVHPDRTYQTKALVGQDLGVYINSG